MKNLLEIQNLHKRYGGVQAVNNLSFTVQEASITALIGPNGCGKTTAFNLICGFEKPDEGVSILNKQELPKKPHLVAKAGISRTFQNTRLFSNLTVQEHVQLALNNNDYSILQSLKQEEDKQETIQQALQAVGFNNKETTKAQDLSYGQKKLLDLAIANARKHEILLLDEPVAGVNPKLREHIKTLLLQLKKQGRTVLLIEHDMNFVMEIADTIHVMNQGTILMSGTPQQVREDKRVLEAYLGE